MSTQPYHRFWVWQDNFQAVMAILASFTEYPLQEMDLNAILYELQDTNDEEKRWGSYFYQGPQYEMTLDFAKDVETDIVHLKIKAPRELMVQIQTLRKIEGMVKKLELHGLDDTMSK